MSTERRAFALRLGSLVAGAALTGVLLGKPGPGVLLAAFWLAANLIWLRGRVGNLLGLHEGRHAWLTALRLVALASGLWVMLEARLADALDVLIAVTWMYPGLAVSYLVRQERIVDQAEEENPSSHESEQG